MRATGHHHWQNHSTGFTLLELLVAIAVFAVMSVMAYGGLSSVISNNSRSSEALERLQNVQHTLFTIGRDLTQIVKRDIRDEYGNTQSYLIAGNSPDYMVEFTRGGRRNPAKLQRSHLLRAAYRFDEETLSRLFWPDLDRAQNVEPYETVLLDDVVNVEFRYLDVDGEWHEQWPPLSVSDSQGASALELIAIEFSLELNDWGKIVRLFKVNS